jgi:hypothetical protein
MQLPRECLTALAAQGHITLQIPELNLTIDTDRGHARATASHVSEGPAVEEFPDEWFTRLKGDCPATGRQSGFLYFTRAGYWANQDALRAALEAAIARGLDRTDGEGWPAFHRYAEAHFSAVAGAVHRKIRKLQAELDVLRPYTP